MQEDFKQQFPQSKNLALERAEAVKLHNEILEETNKEGDNTTSDKVSQMETLREKVGDIDKYKNLAKSFNDQYYYRVGDISNIEKLKAEKQKIDIEVEKMQASIQETKTQLNQLREKLGMEPTDDIPSLSIKNERLPYLQGIQNDLKNKLEFESKKVELQVAEKTENSNRESKNLDNSIESINSNLSNLSRLLEERQSQGYSQIFQNQEAFRSLASSNPDTSNFEEVKAYFSNLNNVIENLANSWSTNDSPGSLYNISRVLKQLSETTKELGLKIQNEEQKKELSSLNSSVAENIDKTSSLVNSKAQALEAYNNVRI